MVITVICMIKDYTLESASAIDKFSLLLVDKNERN